jgi:hypothetical protein
VSVVWVLSFAALYAVTTLDYDWRFRAPVMPQFILLAAIGAHALILAFQARRNAAPSESQLPAASNSAT